MRQSEAAMIRASIIIPAYNAEATVERAVMSALLQTEPDLEVLVIDDGSTDATAAIVEHLAGCDDRVSLLRQPRNRGPAAARNRASIRRVANGSPCLMLMMSSSLSGSRCYWRSAAGCGRT